MEHTNERLPIFTERFRKLQGEQSNTEFAEFLGISRQTVGFYCNGNRVPDAITLTKIAKKCRVSTDWLLGLSETKSIDADVQSVCKQTGLSDGIAKYLLNNQGYPQQDSFIGFAPIKYFNRFFSPEDLHSFLVALCAYFVDIETIKKIQCDAIRELTQMQESCNIATAEFFEEEMSLCSNKWYDKILSQQKEYRYRRFETIDFFTKLLDSVETREGVLQCIRSTEEICVKCENLEFEFGE